MALLLYPLSDLHSWLILSHVLKASFSLLRGHLIHLLPSFQKGFPSVLPVPGSVLTRGPGLSADGNGPQKASVVSANVRFPQGRQRSNSQEGNVGKASRGRAVAASQYPARHWSMRKHSRCEFTLLLSVRWLCGSHGGGTDAPGNPGRQSCETLTRQAGRAPHATVRSSRAAWAQVSDSLAALSPLHRYRTNLR